MTPERLAEIRVRYPSLTVVGELLDHIEELEHRLDVCQKAQRAAMGPAAQDLMLLPSAHTSEQEAHAAARVVCDRTGRAELEDRYLEPARLSDTSRRFLAQEARPVLEMLGLVEPR